LSPRLLILSFVTLGFLASPRLICAQQPAGFGQSIYPYRAMACPTATLRCCCDDYCRKPCPCVPNYCSARCPDDYCRKSCPFIPCYAGGCAADCYCRKPCPDLCRPLATDYFTCCTASQGCADSHFQGPGGIVSGPLSSSP